MTVDHCLSLVRAVDRPTGAARYGRMFDGLEPLVAEVLLGLLRADPARYLSLEPDWQPALPARGDAFDLADLLIP
ncbi:hypothetical protein [Paractinoplanes hotanensis]|uniref:Uncharacterized protein n=1 Tax=Paractinoplanes hotanensis TaxID=2906497 RepID=A0ABT0YBB5_9ACTN|nr:hypothetical protein [Actinoplanes hotanensis]MCM4082818.1 hypothetical protein [Actinoplanes hotanensis]